MPFDRQQFLESLTIGQAQEQEDFFTERMSFKQRRALRSAQSETRRSERMLRRAIGDDAVDAELRGGRIDSVFENGDLIESLWSIGRRATTAMSTATQPLFDLLQIGQFTGAGAVLEIVNGGNSYEALRRASSEFLNALPFIDEEDARAVTGVDPTRASFRDVLEAKEWKPFESDRHNEWGIAAAGLVMDIVFDPTTWVGGAALKAVGRGVGKAAMPFVDAPGISRVREGLGRRFVPKFEINEMVRKNPDLKGTADQFLTSLEQRRGDISAGSIEIEQLAIQLRSDLSPTQARFLQMYMDQPKHFEGIVNELTVGNPGVKDLMMGKFNAFRKAYKKLADDEVAAGLMDPTILKANYAPARWESTTTSARSFKDLMRKLGLPEQQQGLEISDVLRRSEKMLGETQPIFATKKKLHTVEQRVLLSVGTELDPGASFALRGLEHVRARATKRFVDSVLTDPNVALRINDPILIETIKKGGGGKTLQQLIEEYGPREGAHIFNESMNFAKKLGTMDLEVWRPFRQGIDQLGDVASISKLNKGTQFIDAEGIAYEVVSKGAKRGAGKGKIGAVRGDTGERVWFDKGHQITPSIPNPGYVMPGAFARELKLSDKIVSNESEGRKFLNLIHKTTGLWKGWAIASPGFHMRNHYSNVFNNALAGVGFAKGFVPNPLPYARAFALTWNRGKNIALDMPDGTKLVGDEILDLARRHNVIQTGQFAKDVPFDVEDAMLSKLFKIGNQDDFFEKLSTASGRELDQVLETIGDRTITRKDVLQAVGETAPARADFEFVRDVMGQGNPALRLNRLIGEKTEDWSRLTHFMEKIKKGSTPEEAAHSVKRYLFDYQELTEFERDVMKAVMPFYTWMRKNIPLQFQSIFQNPGRYGALTGKPIDAIESLSKDWENITTPDFFAEQHAVRMPREVASLVQTMNETFDSLAERMGADPTATQTGFQPVYLNPNFPFQDLNRLNWKDMLSAMTPIAKLPAELLLGEQGRGFSIFLERPIEKFPGEPTERENVLTGTRISRRAQHFLETVFPTVGKVQRLVDRSARGQGASQILSEGFGIKAMQVDVDRAKRSNIFRRRQQIRAIRQKYQDLGLVR